MPITPITVLHSAVSGMLARQFEMDVIAENLANVNTAGYKPNRADFQELVASEASDNEVNVPFRGASLGVTRLSVSPGPLTPGLSPLELAIEGVGFFAVRTPDGGTAYTRDGRFSRDANGDLVTSAGQRVIWQGALPADGEALHVNPDGSVMAQQNGQWTQVGAIRLYRFDNAPGLLSLGENLLGESESSGAAQEGAPDAGGFGRIISGAVEGSAANLAEEMSDMILAQRAYGLSLKAFQQTDDMIGMAIHLRGG